MMSEKSKNSGTLVISLDLELFWGVRDKRSLETYGSSIKEVWDIVPSLLDKFRAHNVRATFATVGLLFAKNKIEMVDASPKLKPEYGQKNLSPYHTDFLDIGNDHLADPYHFALPLIEEIAKDGNHEIGTHTFSHFYCQEPGQTKEAFYDDIKSAVELANKRGMTIESIVFPRNQINEQYLDVCLEHGILAYRGNERVWFHKPESGNNTSLFKRICRTLDCYINISGHHCYSLDIINEARPLNIPSSRFLRPYQFSGILEWLKLRRIKRSMSYAAKNGLLFHLWWHPHNFGVNKEKNFATLSKILEHYSKLGRKYGFQSMTMADLTKTLRND